MNITDVSSQQILEKISRHCPDAMCVYLHCINRADAKGELHLSKNMVEVQLSEDWDDFIKKIKSLAREDLLFWSPMNDGVAVCLAVDDD